MPSEWTGTGGLPWQATGSTTRSEGKAASVGKDSLHRPNRQLIPARPPHAALPGPSPIAHPTILRAPSPLAPHPPSRSGGLTAFPGTPTAAPSPHFWPLAQPYPPPYRAIPSTEGVSSSSPLRLEVDLRPGAQAHDRELRVSSVEQHRATRLVVERGLLDVPDPTHHRRLQSWPSARTAHPAPPGCRQPG